MKIIQPLRKSLNSCKGSDRWARIAARADCHYFTVAKVASGTIKSPGADMCERLFAAIKATEPRARPRARAS